MIEQYADLLCGEGELDRLFYYAKEVVQFSRSAQAPHLIGGFLAWHLAEIWFHKNGPEVEALLREAESILSQDPASEPALLMLQAGVARYKSGLDEGIKVLRRALERLAAFGVPDRQILIQNSLGLLPLNAGKPKEAERAFNEGLSLLQSFRDEISHAHRWEAVLKGNLAIVKGKQGHYQEACDQLYPFLPDVTQRKSDRAEAGIFLANWQYHLGNIGAARELFAQAEELLKELESQPPSHARQEYEELRRIFAFERAEEG